MLHLLILTANHASLLSRLGCIITFTSIISLVYRIMIALTALLILLLLVSLCFASYTVLIAILVILADGRRVSLLLILPRLSLLCLMMISFTVALFGLATCHCC